MNMQKARRVPLAAACFHIGPQCPEQFRIILPVVFFQDFQCRMEQMSRHLILLERSKQIGQSQIPAAAQTRPGRSVQGKQGLPVSDRKFTVILYWHGNPQSDGRSLHSAENQSDNLTLGSGRR